MVHPFAVESVIVATATVREYQVHQIEQGVAIDVVAQDDADCRALAEAVRESLERCRWPAPEVKVRRVASIERHPEAGQVRRFIAAPR